MPAPTRKTVRTHTFRGVRSRIPQQRGNRFGHRGFLSRSLQTRDACVYVGTCLYNYRHEVSGSDAFTPSRRTRTDTECPVRIATAPREPFRTHTATWGPVLTHSHEIRSPIDPRCPVLTPTATREPVRTLTDPTCPNRTPTATRQTVWVLIDQRCTEEATAYTGNRSGHLQTRGVRTDTFNHEGTCPGT